MAVNRITRIKDYLELEVWPYIPAEFRGKKMTKRERAEILGIAAEGHPE
jgi:hypothetical protein